VTGGEAGESGRGSKSSGLAVEQTLEVVSLGGIAHTIVGVMPAAFRSIPAADVWTPLRLSPNDNSLNYSVIGRLRVDASLAMAIASLEAIRPEMLRGILDTNRAFPTRIERLTWTPFRSSIATSSRPILQLLLGAAALVLLVACANVAALQLVRGSSRYRELATRAALGCAPSRTIRRLLTESVMLGVLGALAGIGIAAGSLVVIRPLLSETFLVGQEVAIDWRVLGAALTLAVLTGLAFGLWPAWSAARMNVSAIFLAGGQRLTGGRAAARLRRLLVAFEVGLAGVLLVGAGLFAREVFNLLRADVGFDSARVLMAKTSMQGNTSSASERTALLDRALGRIGALPGVETVAYASNAPVERTANLAIDPADAIREPRAMDWVYVSPQYFDVFRIDLRAGRLFDAADKGAVAIVNETFARHYFGAPASAVGQTIQLVAAMRDEPRTIVGVVADVRAASGAGWSSGHALAAPPSPIMYVPAVQVPDAIARTVHSFAPVTWAARVRQHDAALIHAIQDVMREVVPQLPIIRFTTMDDLIADSVQLQRTLLVVLGLFSTVTLLLAAVGIFGVVAYGVASRRHEIGVRLALGAPRARVLGGFVGEGVASAAAGALAGLAIAAALSRFLTGFVFGISPLDPATYLVAGMALVALAAAASAIPSTRAARVSPADALRTE
jgi:predicted permease